MIFTTSDVASLSDSLSRWEIGEYICAGLVTVACAGEYVAEFKGWFTSGIKERRDRLAKRSTLLLIVALSLELICLVRTNTISGMLIGSLSEKASAADIKAQSAIEKSSLAENKADALTVRIEAASRKLGELERDILAEGPRWRLLKNGEDAFVKALKPFAGQRVTVVTCGQSDPERYALYQMLFNFFPKAGWAPKGARWAGCPIILTGGNEIFFVASVPSADGRWAESYPCRLESDRVGIEGAAKALCDALNKLNISTIAWKEKTTQDAAMKAREFWGTGHQVRQVKWHSATRPRYLFSSAQTNLYLRMSKSVARNSRRLSSFLPADTKRHHYLIFCRRW